MKPKGRQEALLASKGRISQTLDGERPLVARSNSVDGGPSADWAPSCDTAWESLALKRSKDPQKLLIASPAFQMHRVVKITAIHLRKGCRADPKNTRVGGTFSVIPLNAEQREAQEGEAAYGMLHASL